MPKFTLHADQAARLITFSDGSMTNLSPTSVFAIFSNLLDPTSPKRLDLFENTSGYGAQSHNRVWHHGCGSDVETAWARMVKAFPELPVNAPKALTEAAKRLGFPLRPERKRKGGRK